MRETMSDVSLWLFVAATASCTAPTPERGSVDAISEEIVAIERAALDRWITGDPQGYLDLYAGEVTYFDPNQERRVDGLEAMNALLSPIRDMQLPFTAPRYEMIAPKVQVHGDVALLTFNAVSYGRLADQAESTLARWNASEVYRLFDGRWRIVHSHWSYVRPQPSQGGP